MNRVSELENTRAKDNYLGIYFPWYTRPFLEELIKWNIKNWKVFEYGSGDSTTWWRKNSYIVEAVDTNSEWAQNTGAKFIKDKESFIKYPTTLVGEDKFDCIVIDSDPVEWRDECTEYALKSIKNNGIIIIDNYNQGSINLSNWPITDELLKNYEKYVFKEPTHADWKTAYWIIKNK